MITKSFPSLSLRKYRIIFSPTETVNSCSDRVTSQPQLLLFVFEQFVQRGEEEVGKLFSLQLLRLAGCQLLQQHLHLTPALDEVQLGGGQLLPEEPENHQTVNCI